MWKNIKNVASAVADLAVIAGKEVAHHANVASTKTESLTSQISSKAANLRANYEQHLEERRNPKPATVVTTSEDKTTNLIESN